MHHCLFTFNGMSVLMPALKKSSQEQEWRRCVEPMTRKDLVEELLWELSSK